MRMTSPEDSALSEGMQDMSEHEVDEAQSGQGDEGVVADAADASPVNEAAVEAEIVDAEDPPPAAPAALSALDLGLELSDDPDEREAALLGELAATRAEATEYLDTLQRVAAEFDNYRKRVERDQADTVMRASQRLVESLLPTLDAFDAALSYETQTPAEEKILDGMRGTHVQLMETLAREGIEPIAAEGVAFDPAVHEAVAGGGSGDLVVAQELRRGYVLRGRVIRPALVMVEETS